MSCRIEEVTDEVAFHNALGTFYLRAFQIREDGSTNTHLCVRHGDIAGDPVPVRINSACLTSEALGDGRCDCSWQLTRGLERFVELGAGLMTYHPSHEGRGIGLFKKIQSYALMDRHGLSTAEAFRAMGEAVEQRDYSAAVAMLTFYGVRSVLLLSNNPDKARALREGGIAIHDGERLLGVHNERWWDYLGTKARDFGHDISLPGVVAQAGPGQPTSRHLGSPA
jgi:GTP cyclohydrolase II